MSRSITEEVDRESGCRKIGMEGCRVDGETRKVTPSTTLYLSSNHIIFTHILRNGIHFCDGTAGRREDEAREGEGV